MPKKSSEQDLELELRQLTNLINKINEQEQKGGSRKNNNNNRENRQQNQQEDRKNRREDVFSFLSSLEQNGGSDAHSADVKVEAPAATTEQKGGVKKSKSKKSKKSVSKKSKKVKKTKKTRKQRGGNALVDLFADAMKSESAATDAKPAEAAIPATSDASTTEQKGGQRNNKRDQKDNKRDNKKNRRQDGGRKKTAKDCSGTFRHFKIVEVDGKAMTFGRIQGCDLLPSNAAVRAYRSICDKMNMKNDKCKARFYIKETTSGSKKKVYGPYKGERVKLSKPKVIKVKDDKGKTVTYEVKFKPRVEYLGKSGEDK